MGSDLKGISSSPSINALYAIPAHQASVFLTDLCLAEAPLAVQLTVSLAGPVEDLHLQIT